jgi:hypothetical protein
VVVLNAAAALVAAGTAGDLADGVRRAEAAVDSGSALSRLEALIRFTQLYSTPPALTADSGQAAAAAGSSAGVGIALNAPASHHLEQA